MLRRRLCIAVFEQDFPCPLCAGMMDTWGDHALVCACGGDRTMRHNTLRDLVLRLAKSAGHHAVAEKPGLLPPRLNIGGAWENGLAGSATRRVLAQDRRPADVWLPTWMGGLPAAIDLAVTSGLQSALLELTATDGTAATDRYAERKITYLNTAEQCKESALQSMPFVVEADGSLGREARTIVAKLARDTAKRTGEAPSIRTEWATQALSVALQRANAVAIARRACGPLPLAPPLAAARAQLQYASAAAATTTVLTDTLQTDAAVSAPAPRPTSPRCFSRSRPCAGSRRATSCPSLCSASPCCAPPPLSPTAASARSCSPPALTPTLPRAQMLSPSKVQ